MKILLNGYYGFGNFGDDLLLINSFNAVKRFFPQSEVTVFSNYTENLHGYSQREGYCDYIKVILGADVPVIDWTFKGHFDMIVHGGGGVFFDNPGDGVMNLVINSMAISMGVKRYSKLMAGVRKLIGKPKNLSTSRRVGIGIGLGPYHPKGSRFKHEAEIIGEFSRLVVRDPESFAWSKRIGIHDKTRMLTDLVFGTENWMPELPLPSSAPWAIGIVMCQGKKGNEELIDFFESKNSAEFPDRMYIFLDENHDAELIERCEKSGLNVLVWRPWDTTVSEFLQKLRSCKMLITNRAHGAIVGACLNIPSLCMDTDVKLHVVQGMIRSGSKLIEMPLDKVALKRSIVEMLGNLESYKKGLDSDLASRKVEVKEMIEYAFA